MQRQLLAIDIECYDPNLQELGNGAIRQDGSVLCISTYDGDKSLTYYPEDFPKLKDLLSKPSYTWIAHNSIYDFDWIQNGLGYNVAGKMEDTMTRQGLIYEYAGRYDLDSCCLREEVQGKNKDDTIELWWKEHGGKGPAIKNLQAIPKEIVASYNQQDCKATYNLFLAQQTKIEALKLQEINDLEAAQIPIILEMRKNGIRIDVAKINKLRDTVTTEVEDTMVLLSKEYGITSLAKRKGPGSLPYVLEQLGLTDQLARSPKGGISVAYESLIKCSHPLVAQVIDLRRRQTLLDKYLNSAFTKFTIGDRIHGTFKPTQRDDGGTITGRYSSSDPNMQNFSAREVKGGDLVRGCFLPNEDTWLAKLDYSQIEYRLLAHYAVGPGATQLREVMQHGADYHRIVQDMLGRTGKDARKIVKNFNFGMIYGMGLNTFKKKFELEAREAAAAMGMTTDQYTQHYYNEYMRRMTYVKPTTMAIQCTAQANGCVRSIGGRLHRNPPDGGLYKMTNYLIQGSAADINKMGLRDAWASGVFNTLKLHLTVHDESVCSVPKNKEGLEAVKELQRCMCECTKLRVPIRVDPGIGKNWYKAGEGSGKRAFELACNKEGVKYE